jgi:PEP-CTERM motif
MRSLGLCGVLLSIAAHAATITFLSVGTATDPNQTNSTGLNTIPIAMHPAWADPIAGSQWVSYGITGDPNAPGYFVVDNGTIVTFTQTFFLTGTPLMGSVGVMADDSTSVILNGMLLMLQPSHGEFHAPTNVDLTPALHSGLNTLQFQVQQVHAASFGLDYSGSASSTATPEPSSLAMFGFGLVGLSVALRRGRRQELGLVKTDSSISVL